MDLHTSEFSLGCLVPVFNNKQWLCNRLPLGKTEERLYTAILLVFFFFSTSCESINIPRQEDFLEVILEFAKLYSHSSSSHQIWFSRCRRNLAICVWSGFRILMQKVSTHTLKMWSLGTGFQLQWLVKTNCGVFKRYPSLATRVSGVRPVTTILTNSQKVLMWLTVAK